MKTIIINVMWVWLMVTVLMGYPAMSAQVQSCENTFYSALVQLMPCRPAVTPFSPAPPSDACCNALKALGQPCLCVLLSGPPLSGIDRNMASQLPGKCTVDFEPCFVV